MPHIDHINILNIAKLGLFSICGGGGGAKLQK